MKASARDEQRLMTELWDPAIADDPERFVLFAYPWGKSGTPLADFKGPRTWQRDDLAEISDHVRRNKDREVLGLLPEMWRKATSSGRGVGKSAEVSWLSHWMMTTRLGSTTLVTANNETQLKTRTFAEIGKWLTMAINGHWFESTVLSVKPQPWFEKLLKEQMKIDTGYYYTAGQLWSEENPDAFAGIHNPLGVNLIFDEASGIPKQIFNVSEGFFTEPTQNRFWNVFSQGRRNSGGFFDIFHDPATSARWRKRQLDRRTVEGQDQALTDAEIIEHGEDSDHVRVEVFGQFPSQGNKQFISNGLVYAAQQRELVSDDYAPLILGVDVARFGNDMSVFRYRQGRDARSIPPVKFKDRDNMAIANAVAKEIDEKNPDAVNIDAGNGTGVIDRLTEMGYRVNEVWFGSTKGVSAEWANKRTEMYADMRDWLGGAAIDGDPRLFTDLTAPEYHYFGKAQDAIMLESKESMKGRGLPSPDDGDALALTFAVKVPRKDRASAKYGRRRHVMASNIDYRVI